MRENRPYGSEGGGRNSMRPPYPYPITGLPLCCEISSSDGSSSYGRGKVLPG
jgi:hypothetical protein